MIWGIIISTVVAGGAIADTPARPMPIRLEWVREAKSLLSSVQATDRPAAYRDYADMLVDVGECDAAVNVLKSDTSFDAELIVTTMAHASFLGERYCAGQLGRLAKARIGVSATTRRRAELLMQAGAAIRVGGDDAEGAAIIASAERSLDGNSSEPSVGSGSESRQTLWAGRRYILSTYAGTPLFAPTMTRYGQELAANLSLSRSYLPMPDLRGFALRFGASGRMDLVELIASKLLPSGKREILSAASVAGDPELAETYGDKAAPHCVKVASASGSTPMTSDKHGPFEAIVSLALKSGLAAINARCAASTSTPKRL